MDGGKHIQRVELRKLLQEVRDIDRPVEETADLILQMIYDNYTIIEPEEEVQEQTGE